MTFLNPLVLIGLAAASIPLILHLLNLRKPRTIEFSTLSFLKELQQTSIRRLKLRQILLLILRTALIVLIVLSFARPVLRGSILGSVGTHARTSAILLLDDSFSMSTRDERGGLFKQAKEKAGQLVDLLKEGDEAAFLRFSDLPGATMERVTHDFAQLKPIIQESPTTASSGSLHEMLRLSAKLLATSHNANKEIYILSDMQQTLLDVRDGSSLPRAQEQLFLPDTKFFVLQFGSEETDNTALDSISIISRIFEAGRPVELSARIRNHGKTPLRDVVVSAYLEDQRLAQRNVDLPARGSATARFTVIPKRTGFVSGYLGIEEDALELDNKRWFTIFIPERIRVALLSPSREDVQFVALSLTPDPTERPGKLFDIQHSTPRQFPMLDLTSVDVLVVSNAPSFSENDAERIKAFVEQGGGLVMFPGDAMQIASYNTTLLPLLNIPPVEGGDRPATTVSEAGLTFQNVDTDHPIFDGMFERSNQRLSVESPNVFIAINRQTGRHGRTIVSLTDQLPFLSEYRVGEGIVLLFASAPNLRWTDFPVKGLFAPVMYRSALYAASQADRATNATVGDEPTITMIRSPGRLAERKLLTRRSAFTLISPNGGEEILPHREHSTPVGSSITFSLNKVTEPGVYEIRNDRHVITQLSVNVSPRESDLRKAEPDELEKFLSGLGIDRARVATVSPQQNLDTIVLQSRFGVELWRLFLIAALVIAGVEMVVARDSSGEIRQMT